MSMPSGRSGTAGPSRSEYKADREYIVLVAVRPLDERTYSAVRHATGGGPVGPHPGGALR